MIFKGGYRVASRWCCESGGRGDPEIIETGRQICIREYSGIKGFRNVYEKLEIEFHTDQEAREILELVRYANVL